MKRCGQPQHVLEVAPQYVLELLKFHPTVLRLVCPLEVTGMQSVAD